MSELKEFPYTVAQMQEAKEQYHRVYSEFNKYAYANTIRYDFREKAEHKRKLFLLGEEKYAAESEYNRIKSALITFIEEY
jgi:hypothetical protein